MLEKRKNIKNEPNSFDLFNVEVYLDKIVNT